MASVYCLWVVEYLDSDHIAQASSDILPTVVTMVPK